MGENSCHSKRGRTGTRACRAPGNQRGQRRPKGTSPLSPCLAGEAGTSPHMASRRCVHGGHLPIPFTAAPNSRERRSCALPVARLGMTRAHGQMSYCGATGCYSGMSEFSHPATQASLTRASRPGFPGSCCVTPMELRSWRSTAWSPCPCDLKGKGEDVGVKSPDGPGGRGHGAWSEVLLSDTLPPTAPRLPEHHFTQVQPIL